MQQTLNVMKGRDIVLPGVSFQEAQSYIYRAKKDKKGYNLSITRNHMKEDCPATSAHAKAYGRRNHIQWHQDYSPLCPVG